MGKKKKESKRKGKRKPSKRPHSEKWKMYSKEGDSLKKRRFCPRCGPGVFLADHGDRYSCGKCGYTEFKK